MAHSADQPNKERAGVDDPTVVAAILQLLSRIEAVVTDENGLLSSGNTADIDAIIARKSHLAVEVMRLMKRFDALHDREPLRVRMSSLSRALDTNARLLRRHIDAVREISGIITDVIAASSDDGTYSGRLEKTSGATW